MASSIPTDIPPAWPTSFKFMKKDAHGQNSRMEVT